MERQLESSHPASCLPAPQQRVLVLVGPPGSGKSTLAALLHPDFHRISQDVLGSRPKCLAAAEAAMQKGHCVVIDRCNFDPDQRSTWVHLAHRMGVPAVAIVLHAPVQVCLQRVGARRGHEGGIEGTGHFATGVVARMSSDLKPVGPAEGFADICTYQHHQSPYVVAADVLNRFGLPLQPNWVPLRDQSNGRLYYGNALTKVTTWNRPSVPPAPREAPVVSAIAGVSSLRLWVGNLHPLADKDWLLRHFKSFGDIADACVSMDNRRRPVVSKGWGYVEFREASSASAAQAAMDGAVLPPPAPELRPRSPHRQPQHGRLVEMGFKAQSVDRALELAGGEEEAALVLLLDGAVDSTQQEEEEEQQQQHVRPISVSFSKATARAALPQTRPRGQSRSSSRESADARNFSPQDEPHPTLPPLPLPAVAAAAALDAVAEGSPVVAAAVVEDSPNDWVLLQHPDDRSVVAYGNIVTHEFSLQLPAYGGGSSAGGGSEGC